MAKELSLKEHVQVAGGFAPAAKTLGISKSTLIGRLASEYIQKEYLPEEEATHRLKVRRLEDRLSQSQRLQKETEGRAIAAEDELDRMKNLCSSTILDSSWSIPVTPDESVSSPPVTKIPVLFTSDFQCGEVIKGEEIDGMNSYNSEIFAERYDTLITKTIQHVRNNIGSAQVPGIFYLRGGDAISGGIHAELKDTDDLSSIPAICFLHKKEVEGIKRLKAEFGTVKVISIPGNHGRLMGPWGLKPRSKGYVETNLETLLACWLASTFEGDPNVEFYTPASGDAYFDVLGWKFLMAHGDRMGSRGGQGFVGPAATIARGHQKLFQNWSASNKHVDYILTGHLHTSLKLQRGFANGSLAGFGEFARDIQALPDAAKQWLFIVTEGEGIEQFFEVVVSAKPTRKVAKF